MNAVESVRLTNPGPLTSTASQTSASSAAATTASATSRGFRPKPLGQGQRAVGLEVGPVGRPQDRVGPRLDGVEGRLQAAGEDGLGVGHGPSSHFGRYVRPGSAAFDASDRGDRR